MTTVLSVPAPPVTPHHLKLPALASYPKVSVLITCYNYADYLGNAIDSVLAQSWNPLEIIVSDDGSQDRSCEVAESYRRRNLPVVLLRGEHGGMAACLNAAFENCSGDVICLLDADDFFFPQKIESVISAFQAGQASGLCIHQSERMDSAGRRHGPFPLLQKLPTGDCTDKTVENAGILMGLPPTSALSLRREVAERIFPIPPVFTGYAEQMIHRIAPLITSICAIERPLSSWTLHSRNDANSSHVKPERLQRELLIMENLWQRQHDFLEIADQTLADRLSPLCRCALYAKMKYILSKLTKDKQAEFDHAILCDIPSIRESYLGMFWEYSNRLPGPVFRKCVDIIETQGSGKHLLAQILRLAKHGLLVS